MPVLAPRLNAITFAAQTTTQRQGTRKRVPAPLDASITKALTRQTTGTALYGLLTGALSQTQSN